MNSKKTMKIKNAIIRPKLTIKTPIYIFLNYYWLKEELLAFCTQNKLPTHGGKLELMSRIESFLKNNDRIPQKIQRKKTNQRDSASDLTLKTVVNCFKNDLKTRNFFIQHIGKHFHFNAYLREFAKESFKNKENITYGELIKGWIKSEELKKQKDFKTEISPQFEYMQFIRDYFANEKNKTRDDAIAAWHFIKTQPGKRSYARYKKMRGK